MQPVPVPGGQLIACPCQDPEADIADRPHLLGNGYKALRRDGAELTAVPAQQGFGTGEAALCVNAGEMHLRLEEQRQLVFRQWSWPVPH